MPDLYEQATGNAAPLPVMSDNLTTAPGDLPLSEIVARIATQKHQFRHDNTLRPIVPLPSQPTEIWSISGDELLLGRAAIFYTVDGRLPDEHAFTIPMERVCTDWNLSAGYLTRWRGIIPGQAGQTVVRYRIGGWEKGQEQREMPTVWAQDGQGFWFHYSGSRALTTFAYSVEEPAPVFPAWAQQAIIYQIFLDRFRTSAADGAFHPDLDPKQFHGGTLRGVYDALPYLADLGITCLWLSPINPAESYDRYSATDFYTIDPLLGNGDDLKMLTGKAHALGMRVLLDFVPSHLSRHHPAFVAAFHDQNAPTFPWFTFYHWPDQYRSFLDTVPALVSLNGANEDARTYIIDSAIQWLRDYGIDGFRLDHAIGQGMDFWTAFRRATREIVPDAISIGEVTDTPDSLRSYRGKLDGILDFPLASALRHTFGTCDWDLKQFDSFLDAYEHFMSSGPGRVSFLDNHDMDRYLFIAGNNTQQLKMAALCQFTLASVPVIYYGTEIGMSQQMAISQAGIGGDTQARQDMIWNQQQWDNDVLNFYRALIQMRKERPVLHQGERRTIHLNVEQQTYGYLRTHGTYAPDDVLVLFNISDHAQSIALPETITVARLLLTTGEKPAISADAHEVQLTAHSAVVLSLV